MRRLALCLGLAALTGCVQKPPDHSFPVFFTPFSTNLDPAAADIVASAAAVAKKFPNYPVRVSGYADPIGSPEDNIKLSRARADAVAAMLIQDGVPDSRISREAAGTPSNSQPGIENRRAEIDIDLP